MIEELYMEMIVTIRFFPEGHGAMDPSNTQIRGAEPVALDKQSTNHSPLLQKNDFYNNDGPNCN